MKKIHFLTLLFAIVSLISSAQDLPTKNREVGITLNGVTSFGIRYRAGNENTLLRITLLSVNGNNTSNKNESDQSANSSSGGIGLNLGFEKRKSITNNLGFYSGADLLMSYSKNSYKNSQSSYSDNTWTMSPGIGVVLGFIYKINDDINISAEVVPSIVYNYSKTTTRLGITVSETTQTSKGLSYGFSNSVGNLTLSFRLGRKHQTQP